VERAAESIYANIAEGSASGRNRNYARFVQYAIASSSELESHLAFAKRIHAITAEVHTVLSDETIEVRKMLIGLKKYLLRTPDE
jgi:four helix bundle protein